jgi:proline iminopeptidase
MSNESTPDKYSILQDLNDLEDIRKQLGIEKWNVLGHSFGGYTAMMYATIYPQSVKSVIVVSTPFGFTDQEDEENNTALMSLFKDVVTQEDNIKALIKLSFYTIPPNDTIKYLLQSLYSYGYYEKFQALSANYVANSEKTFEKYVGNPCGENFPTLSMPLLAVVGKQDAVGFWKKTEQYFNEKQPNAKIYIFEKSAHFPWIEENEKFFSLVKEFLIIY